ncbi:TetR family transcriptional regulator [Mangrovibacter phragmitis]|uniref:TetR family transcriptional regulator n=1 Tax=Mangrovibacter phragmitis TaxID=1691903 RepID=A0A1B7KY82_9ENTR|nr:TetR/AcrR family transcriptional regulator [Mangrovibacter phragmitis]OAT74967.1 TetR family transcriptional regulator [Mangrovibacter phragmitis]
MTTDVSGCVKKSRGRPKVFDREDALDKAMALFWRHGYEATSLSHLVEATGAKAPTLYAEFTNKEGLFRAVLDRYIARFVSQYEAQLFASSKPLAEALKDYMVAVALCYTSKETPQGCFIITTSSALAASSEKVAEMIRQRHVKQAQALITFLVQRQARGELSASCQCAVLGNYLSCIVQGMSVSAREGASFETLEAIINTALSSLPGIAQ